MIDVRFYVLADGSMMGFGINGHSGYANQGEDIVCAAVSSAAFMTINTVTDVLSVSPKSVRADDGDMFFSINEKDIGICKDFLQGLKNHLISLEEQYGEYIRVSYVEV